MSKHDVAYRDKHEIIFVIPTRLEWMKITPNSKSLAEGKKGAAGSYRKLKSMSVDPETHMDRKKSLLGWFLLLQFKE